jgi:hypothetical protein
MQFDRWTNRSAWWCLMAVTLVGCATGPRFVTNADPDADFAQFRTFTFEEKLGTDRADGTRTLLSHHLIESTTAELQARGYVLGDQTADLTLNFYVSTQEKLDVRQVPAPGWGGFYGYRYGLYGVWYGYDTEVRQYTEGTLAVDVIDTRKKQLVWEGAVVGRVRDLGEDGLEGRIRDAIRDLFSRYPYRAGA